jgi:hypothetical protein
MAFRAQVLPAPPIPAGPKAVNAVAIFGQDGYSRKRKPHGFDNSENPSPAIHERDAPGVELRERARIGSFCWLRMFCTCSYLKEANSTSAFGLQIGRTT